MKQAELVVDAISFEDSYEDVMAIVRQGLFYMGLGFCFLFLVPNLWIGRLPSREEMTLLKNRSLNNSLDRTSQAQSGQG